MLWAIRDSRNEWYDGGTDVTIVRASSRAEALRLWLEADSDPFEFFGKLGIEEQKMLDALKERDLPEDHELRFIQVIKLDTTEGKSEVLVSGEVPDLPPSHQPKPKSEPDPIVVDAAAFALLAPPKQPEPQYIRMECSNTLSAAFKR